MIFTTSNYYDATSITVTVPDGTGAQITIVANGVSLWDPDKWADPVESPPRKKQPFFPETSRAPKLAQVPRQAPKPVPQLHLLHFANQRVWNRRNRPVAL